MIRSGATSAETACLCKRKVGWGGMHCQSAILSEPCIGLGNECGGEWEPALPWELMSSLLAGRGGLWAETVVQQRRQL